MLACRCDGIGRRDGLKIRWWQHCAGSTPATGTKNLQAPDGACRFLLFHYYFFTLH